MGRNQSALSKSVPSRRYDRDFRGPIILDQPEFVEVLSRLGFGDWLNVRFWLKADTRRRIFNLQSGQLAVFEPLSVR